MPWSPILRTGTSSSRPAELRSRGVEAEVSARLRDAWTLVASYAYNEANILEDTNTAIVGNRLAGVPRHQASLWTSWAFDGALAGLTLGGGVFHGSRQATTTANTLFLPAYTRLDLNAHYAFGKDVELLLNLDNVTDEPYYITGGFSQIYPQPPRSWRLTLSKRW